MTSEAQSALVDLFRVMERIQGGKPPSNELVFDTARELGVRFKDRDAKAVLKKFRPGRAPARPRTGSASAGADEHENRGPAPSGLQNGPGRAGATRARDNGTPVPSSNSSAPSQVSRGDVHERAHEEPLDDDEIALPARPPASIAATDLARWFVDTALDAKALPEHQRLYAADLALRDLAYAQVLLASHARPEIERRAQAMFARKNDRRDPLRKAVTLRTLSEIWDWFEPVPVATDRTASSEVVPASNRSIDTAVDVAATW